jgi:hypothetical protein
LCKELGLKLSKIIKFKNKTLGFFENEDSSQNTNEIVPKEKFNNLEKKLKFPLLTLDDLSFFMFTTCLSRDLFMLWDI